jgi:hypothetical protein
MARPDPTELAQRDFNTGGDSDRERAMSSAASRLRDREIPISGRETGEQLADMLSAVEQFEAAVAALGGDSMNNAPDSADPEEPRYVLPRRAEGESAGEYTARLRDAAERLAARAD